MKKGILSTPHNVYTNRQYSPKISSTSHMSLRMTIQHLPLFCKTPLRTIFPLLHRVIYVFCLDFPPLGIYVAQCITTMLDLELPSRYYGVPLPAGTATFLYPHIVARTVKSRPMYLSSHPFCQIRAPWLWFVNTSQCTPWILFLLATVHNDVKLTIHCSMGLFFFSFASSAP